ncbi:class I SAM-dependent DNA methyltransferase [Pedobacter sp. MC2016-24]|uniref:HsdM family class I SAM-dependent methyltransferase n=1 Tax=Pedobacter sp. MC2016-24 TaxID=2780090 RepID=UPI00187FD426|nr:N-6 DNA methylase [Pedobacter sp. MC2016-24]MBE9597865.1 N-6 DNA methylase [Pedobacter sp. MC2016-24]
MKKLQEIFLKLGLGQENGLFITKDNKWKAETSFPNRVKRLLEKRIEPDAIFVFDNKPLILFFDSPVNKTVLHEAIWNFNECPIAIIVENNIVEIFNGFSINEDTKLLKSLGGESKLNDFSYFELVTGRTWEQYKDDLHYKNRVDYHLLQNIKGARQVLVGKDETRAKLVNAMLGKVIFIRYLIDRKVKMKFDGKLRPWTNSEFCDLLDHPHQVQQFFKYLEDKEKGFNGDLFPLSEADYQKITIEDYKVLNNLLRGYDFAVNQPSLFELYDFSIIPIEFISNVYEMFIGKDNQKDAGAYYTPLFLVDYILKETVEKKLYKSNEPINNSDDYSYCKVLDPACGSGIFLVETLRKIIEKYIDDTGIEIKSEKFKTVIKNLAKENIYGVDKDLSAVQVAIFSIYLTLLDYLEPPGIETFKFPILFNSNFFEGDFFDVNAPFNEKLNEIEFSFILGNPPWKGNGMDKVGTDYLKIRKRSEIKLNRKYEVAINNNEIAEGFVLRASDFTRKNTQIAFIIRSSSLYNLGYKKDEFSAFRQYLLEEYFIDRVFELAPVRHEVFEKSNQPAVAPAAVIFYRYANGENTNNHILYHISLKQSRFFSLFKIFTINRSDYKKVQQSKLKQFDWLWKVLVYGSYLDFNFIRRLKEDYFSIKQVINDKERFIYATGFHSRSKPLENPKDTSRIENIPFIKTSAIDSFFINYEDIDVLETEKIDIIKDARIYDAPMLLTRKGLNMSTLTVKNSISSRNLLFKDGITSVKALNEADKSILFDISSILSSDLFAYYAVNTFVSIGIEREQVQNYNKFSLPYLELDTSENCKKIEQAKMGIHLAKKEFLVDNFKIGNFEKEISTELEKINQCIYSRLDLNDVEYSLIDYSLKINRELIIGNEMSKNRLFSYLSFEDESLNIYAQTFLNRFKSNLGNDKRKFIVEIWHTKQIIGMLFKVIPVEEYLKDIVWVNRQDQDNTILSFLIKISSEKITDQLFVQKDIRGFEIDQNYFYIFKPNERCLWHKAIGYLDVQEFSDAILKAGRKGN